MRRRDIIIVTALVIALIIATPVSAYSISVSGGTGDKYTSSRYQSYIKGIQTTKYQPGGYGITSGSGTHLPVTQGSVSAFSNGVLQDQNTIIEFKQTVSVDGSISGFSFSAKYDSGVFR